MFDLRSGASLQRFLIITRRPGTGTPDGQQVQGLLMYQKVLRKELKVNIDLVSALTREEVAKELQKSAHDAVMVMVDWAEKPEALIELFKTFRRQHEHSKLIFLDYYAPTCSPHFGVLPYVDLYVKRQVLRDRALYQKQYQGGFVLPDYLARHKGYDIGDWHFGSIPNPDYEQRIEPGWNLGVTPRYRRLLRWTQSRLGRAWFAWRKRPIDLNARFAPKAGDDSWYARYRQDALALLEPMRQTWKCSGTTRLTSRRYYWEMLHSKIVVSPFGWGELCFRDYEAVACGALLVKPSMAHLETNPDIFVDGKTYVPVKWDLSDLEEKCTHYLTHLEEAEAIVRQGQAALYAYFEDGGFVRDIERILRRAQESAEGEAARI